MIQSLIKDENALRTFVETMFPTLEKDQVLIFILLARNKYAPEIKQGGNVFRDLINTNDIDLIMDKIKRYSLIGDWYVDLKTRIPLPLHSFVYYINLIPKSMIKGFKIFQQETMDLLEKVSLGKESMERFQHLKVKFYSAIQRSNAYRPYTTIDIDKKDENLLYEVLKLLEYKHTWINETRGGFHVLIRSTDLTKAMGKVLFREIPKMQDVEVKKEAMTPFTGTLQGGFLVKRYEL